MAMDLKDKWAMEAAQRAKNVKKEFKGTGRQKSQAMPDGQRKTLKDGTVLKPRSQR